VEHQMAIKTRIKPLELPISKPLQARMDKIIPRGMDIPQLYLSVARNEQLFMDLIDMQFIGPKGLLERGELDLYLREIVILKTCHSTNNMYEFNLHQQTISEKMGLGVSQIHNLKSFKLRSELWSQKECLLINFVDQTARRVELSDENFKKLESLFTPEILIEITLLIGLYSMVGMLVQLIRPQHDQYQLDNR
jgi:hypothetical protein